MQKETAKIIIRFPILQVQEISSTTRVHFTVPNSTDLIVVGAGPSGLATAIAAKQAGLASIVLEKGSLVDYIRRFPANLVWFSTPELLEIGAVPFVISTLRPTRVDTLNYYRRVAEQFAVDVRAHDAVSSIRKEGARFLVRTEKGLSYDAADVVIATGYFDNPNRLGVPGEDLPHVHHYYDEPFRYAGSTVAVIGGRNSAVEAALDLYRHGVKVTLIHRGATLSGGVKYWILPDMENRIKAGEVAGEFSTVVTAISPGALRVKGQAGEKEVAADFVFVLIGYHPDTAHLSRFGIAIDPETLAPVCREGSFETNVPGLYVAGSVVAGKFNNKIFVENGRLHGGAIVKEILARISRKP
jgi:thioredoxin reductase (NADPH)